MKKLTLLIIAAILMSACVKTKEPPRFSILGDSYSTFEGYVDPDTNNVWEDYAQIGVTDVEQMWWRQVADSTGWVLDRNNSFSGALICNFADFNGGDYYAPNSFLRRMNNLGNPDVIFILGGTNDVWQDAPFGDFVYADWTEEQLCSFRPALACLLDHVKGNILKPRFISFLRPPHALAASPRKHGWILLNRLIVSPNIMVWNVSIWIFTKTGGILMLKAKRTLRARCLK